MGKNFEYLDGLRSQISEVRKGSQPELDAIKVGLDNVFLNVQDRGIDNTNMNILIERAKSKLPDGWYSKWKDKDDNSMWKTACDGAIDESPKIVGDFKGDESELAFIMSWIIAGETVIDRQISVNIRNPLLKKDIGKLSKSVAVIRDGGEDWLEPIEKQNSYNKAIEETKTTFNVDDAEIKKTKDLLKKNLPEEWFGEWIKRNDEMWENAFESVLPVLNLNSGVHIYDKHLKPDFLDRLSWIMRAEEIINAEQSSVDKIVNIFGLTEGDMLVADWALVSNVTEDFIKNLNSDNEQQILGELSQKVIPDMTTENLKAMGEDGQKRLVKHMFEDFLSRMVKSMMEKSD